MRGSQEAFRKAVAPLRRELHVFCYRMLGSFQDAETVLHEAQITAWRQLDSFEPSSSFRAWLYKVVVNACFDVLKTRHRRVLPQELGPPSDPGPLLSAPRDDIAWLEPYPDSFLPAADAQALARGRDSIRLPFVRALQLLPARHRAALILRDVLDWSTEEVASLLGMSVPAANAALQRARLTVADADRDVPRPGSCLDEARAHAIGRFVRAWESGEMEQFVSLLDQDAILALPPSLHWLEGREAIRATFESEGTWAGQRRPGYYRVVPAALNGQPGAISYLRERPDGPFKAVCFTLLGLNREGTRVSELTTFVSTDLLARWGYPLSIH
jgi:RNA polymerase sigma-70 factor (ECF subfamily)